jgi:hypothetical protein
MGQRERNHLNAVRNRTHAELEALFPQLKQGTYIHTSNATARYNCVAFANDNDRKWWEPDLYGGQFHWPKGIGDDVDGWAKIFIDQGYEVTEDPSHLHGHEKIAIYVDVDDNSPSHVAKSNGQAWKSKLGKFQDIEHPSLDILEG